MKRFIIHIAVLFLTFIIGVAVTFAFNKCYIQFEPTGRGSLRVVPDGYGGFTSYQSYDGVGLSFHHVRFPSHESADKAFQNILRDAIRVIERHPLYDRKGEHIVGERVVAIFPPNEFVNTDLVSVICLDNTHLYEITSTSLRHALAFDKAHRRY